MVSPHKIKFNNVESTVLPIDLIIEVAFDGDSGEASTYLNREAIASETHDGRYKRVHRYKYNESFSPRFTFVKKGFGDFSMDEVRQVLKWLTSTSQTALLDVYYEHRDDSATVDWSAIGNWTEISTYKLSNNRTVGIVATFEAVTPYAMSDLETISIASTDNYKKTITVDTDDNQPVYPRITIQQKGLEVTTTKNLTANDDMIENTIYVNGNTCYWKTLGEPIWRSSKTKPNYSGWATVQIDSDYTEEKNMSAMANNTFYYNPNSQTYFWIDPFTFHTDSINNKPNLNTTSTKITNRLMEGERVLTTATMVVKNNTATEKIIVDGANRVISSTNTRRIFGDDFEGWTWLPLFDGENHITVDGNCDVTIDFRCVRKVGEW